MDVEVELCFGFSLVYILSAMSSAMRKMKVKFLVYDLIYDGLERFVHG